MNCHYGLDPQSQNREFFMHSKLRVTSYQLHIVGIFILFVLMTFSCSQDPKISTFTTSYGDFVNSLTMEGSVEAVSSISLSSPRGSSGIISFLTEDGEFVEEGEVVCIIESQNLQTQYDQILIQLENAETGINKTKADLNLQFALMEAQVRTNEADTKIAQMDSLKIAYMSPNQKGDQRIGIGKGKYRKSAVRKKIGSAQIYPTNRS